MSDRIKSESPTGSSRNAHLWVALKHEIIYRMPLFINDHAEAFVTANNTRASRASFTTNFRRGNELIVEARSTWCCIDADTRRPRRISPDIARIFLSDDGIR